MQKKVSFGADYVFANRDVSEDIKESTARQIAKLNDLEFEDMGEYPKDKFLEVWEITGGISLVSSWQK